MTADISRPEMSSLAGFIIVCCVGAALVRRWWGAWGFTTKVCPCTGKLRVNMGEKWPKIAHIPPHFYLRTHIPAHFSGSRCSIPGSFPCTGSLFRASVLRTPGFCPHRLLPYYLVLAWRNPRKANQVAAGLARENTPQHEGHTGRASTDRKLE